MPLPSWLMCLSDDDLAFTKRFLLASGSLKDLATQYGVSYPTIRLRLDRLIQKVKLVDRGEYPAGFEGAARALYTDGRLDAEVLKMLLAAHRREIENAKSPQSASVGTDLDLASD